MARQSGYTLIELLTTLGIATIMVSIALPGLQSFKMNSRQTTGINDLVSGMRVARNTAITTNSRVTVCASKSGKSCDASGWEYGWIAFVDRDADRSLDGNETVLKMGSGVEGLTIKSGEFSSTLVYRPNGRVMNANVNDNNGIFTICDDRGSTHAKAIMLDLSGRPRIVENGSGVSLGCG